MSLDTRFSTGMIASAINAMIVSITKCEGLGIVPSFSYSYYMTHFAAEAIIPLGTSGSSFVS